jgi:hypothetical protein
LLSTFSLRENNVTASRVQSNAAISVEFDLKGPLFIRWQRRDRLALHRFNESRLYALPNCLMLRRLCLRLFDISRRADLKRPDWSTRPDFPGQFTPTTLCQ